MKEENKIVTAAKNAVEKGKVAAEVVTEVAHESKKKFKGLIYGDYFLTIMVIVLGVLFLAEPDAVAGFLQYAIAAFLVVKALIALFLAFVVGTKAGKIFAWAECALNVVLVALIFALHDKFQDALAIIMGISTLFEVAEDVEEIVVKWKSKRKYFHMGECAFHLFLAVELFLNLHESIPTHIVIYGVMFLVKGGFSLMSMTYERYKNGTLSKFGKVIRGMHAMEILGGLFALIIISALALNRLEESIVSFSDGIWYCVSLVTMISTDTHVVTTAVGKFLSAVLGVYGIVIIGLISAIFVNLYLEMKTERENSAK